MRSSIFKKMVDEERPQMLAEEAKRRFLETEKRCKESNARIRSYLRGYDIYADPRILLRATRKIDMILGTFKIEEMLDLGRFGPGSTFACRGTDVSRARKFSLTDVSPEFNKLARGLLAEYPLWAASLVGTDAFARVCPMLEVVPGGRYSTVPKDNSTDRSIIVEPTINSWFQQGIGRMIRRRLKRVAGVDLDDQSVNRRLAKLGSLSQDLATVDLSNASDLISKELVKDLLPQDWYFWLNATRSHRVLIDGNWLELEKFSSMGNGFTFDLESLIFYALASAIAETEGFNTFWVNVFGDDIVVPSGCESLLKAVFTDVGFSINEGKSYFTGDFRESCGEDYKAGVNVRGVYIKRLFTDIDLMRLHNRMYEWAVRCHIDWSRLRRKLLHHLRHIKARVPPHLGDVGIFSSFDEATPAFSRDGWEQYRYTALLPVLSTGQRSDRFLLLDRLQGSDFMHNKTAYRQEILTYRYGTVWADAHADIR